MVRETPAYILHPSIFISSMYLHECRIPSSGGAMLQGDQDHFFPKEMLISPSILKLHKNP